MWECFFHIVYVWVQSMDGYDVSVWFSSSLSLASTSWLCIVWLGNWEGVGRTEPKKSEQNWKTRKQGLNISGIWALGVMFLNDSFKWLLYLFVGRSFCKCFLLLLLFTGWVLSVIGGSWWGCGDMWRSRKFAGLHGNEKRVHVVAHEVVWWLFCVRAEGNKY